MKKGLALVLSLVFMLAMTACGAAKSGQTTFRDILLENGAFRYNGEPITLEAFMEEEAEFAEIFSFTTLDMDGDGEKEILLQIMAPAGDQGGYLELHQGETGVAGFRLSPRAMWELKDDGTFVYSLAAGTEDGIASLAFDGEKCTQTNHFTARGEQFRFSEYRAGETAITEAEYLAAVEAHHQKSDANWWEFTEEAIEEQFPET